MGVALGAEGERGKPYLDLGDLIASIRRGKWLVLLVTVLGVATALFYISTSTPLYTATAEVLVLPVLTSPTRSAEPVSMQTETRLVTSTVVTDVVVDDLGSDAGDVLKHVSVDAIENTEILEISYTDASPETAQLTAQAFADSYLQFKGRQATDSVAQYAAPLRQDIADLDRAIEAADRRISHLRIRSLKWQTALDRRSDLEATRLALLDQLAPITTMSTDPGEVVRSAELPSSPSSPRRQLSLALGVALGLLVGVGIAYAAASTGPRRRSSRRR
ncbi:MAG: Wzz/FepE/Etk N-terminal domain-containing protein [Actinomycetota bacterium]